MDGLAEFEKALAAEKAGREKAGRDGDQQRHSKDRHHRRHHDRHRHRRRHHDDEADADADRRSKRSRHHSRPDEDDPLSWQDVHRRRSQTDQPEASAAAPARDAWMTAPSALQVEHVHRAQPRTRTTPPEKPKRVIHSRELNRRLGSTDDDDGGRHHHSPGSPTMTTEHKADYVFGDAGSSWRMTKLRGVYSTAEMSGRPVDDVAVERYGSLREFDAACEEKEEMGRRKIYGSGYKEKDVPTGDLHRARAQQPQEVAAASDEAEAAAADPPPRGGAAAVVPQAPADQTSLNRLRAQMMRAKMRNAPNAAQLEEEYNRASCGLAPASQEGAAAAVVLGAMHTRQLAGPRGEVRPVASRRGRERGLVEDNPDMTLDDMVREERRTKNQAGGEGLRLAQRIARDGGYANDLEYLDENADKLASRVHRSGEDLKNAAVAEFRRLGRALDACSLCHREDEGRPPAAPVVSLGTRVFLTLAPEPEIAPGGAVIVPIAHRTNLVECDDDEWEELRNFMKSLTRMYHDQGRAVVFYENAAFPARRLHAAMVAVPIPYADGALAPAYFSEAFLSADDEWAQHRKVIDTAASARHMGRAAFRKSIPAEMPYFHAWFSLDGGLGHIVENAQRWPSGDMFAREVLGGIVGAEPHVIRKQGRWDRHDARVGAWKVSWTKFDWTRLLT
ncbi:uncharacterized protein UV8b_00006 [Ustilaginoidea virens]|uniref:Cell cycle control protein n=1 Tax=Ustilaginoidea virens TaxID=1159556 RepID=A0A8E5HI81_USTVR|nr:uncharacterized protein UV8b_00006 [Ustilaginoidea virens]QUC15765.1 hypothetical protein UV8b_00006 [Ustilaginoidea virens]